MERIVRGYMGNYWDNGKENGNYYMGLYGVIFIIMYVVGFRG